MNHKVVPNIRVDGARIESDICIWCGQQTNLTESHIIPSCLGGWFKPYLSCEACNSFLGSKYESEAMRNAFLTAAVTKLGLKSPEEAYRHAVKTDPETGRKVVLKPGGLAYVVPQRIDGNTFFGSLEQGKEYFVQMLGKERPLWPTGPLEEFFDDRKRTIFEYAGNRYSKNMHRRKRCEVSVKMFRDIDPKFIFKMIYEFIAINNLLNNEIIQAHMRQFININTSDNRNRVLIDDDVRRFVACNTIGTFDNFKQFQDIPFHDFHYFVTGISENLILYFAVVLFGQLKNMLIVGPWPLANDSLNILFDRCFILPIRERFISNEPYPCLEWKEAVQWSSAVVEFAYSRIDGSWGVSRGE